MTTHEHDHPFHRVAGLRERLLRWLTVPPLAVIAHGLCHAGPVRRRGMGAYARRTSVYLLWAVIAASQLTMSKA